MDPSDTLNTSANPQTPFLVADIGGTNVRLALAHRGQAEPDNIVQMRCMEFPDPGSAVLSYCQGQGIEIPALCVLSIAGALADRRNFSFTNIPSPGWHHIDFDSLGANIGTRFEVVNDFAAQSYALLKMEPYRDFRTLVSGARPTFWPSRLVQAPLDMEEPARNLLIDPVVAPQNRIVIIGPGTGLGVATAEQTAAGRFHVTDGEGGHASFPIKSAREWEIVSQFQNGAGDISFETVCSGPGLVRIFRAVSHIHPGGHLTDLSHISTRDVVERITSRRCSKATESLEMFTKGLARAAASAVLHKNALGGVFITGGSVVAALKDVFDSAAFEKEFTRCDLRPEINILKGVPVHIVTREQAGLLGAQAYAEFGL